MENAIENLLNIIVTGNPIAAILVLGVFAIGFLYLEIRKENKELRKQLEASESNHVSMAEQVLKAQELTHKAQEFSQDTQQNLTDTQMQYKDALNELQITLLNVGRLISKD